MCCHKLIKKSYVVFAEKSKVFDEIFQVGYTLYAHSECIAGIDIRIYATSLENIRVDHAATKNLNPTCAFTHCASFATAYATANIHLGAWLCEGEIAWTKADTSLRSEHLLCEFKKHLFKISEADILVDI